MASANARRAPMTMAGHASGRSRASSGISPGFVTEVSHAATRKTAHRNEPPPRAITFRDAESGWVRMAWSSPKRDAEGDGDDGGRRDVVGDVPVLRVAGRPANHFGSAHPERPVG